MTVSKRWPKDGPKPYGRELMNYPTITISQDMLSFNHAALNYLKIDTDDKQVWLSSTGMVTVVHKRNEEEWITTHRYSLKQLDKELEAAKRVHIALIEARAVAFCSICNSKISAPKSLTRQNYVICESCFLKMKHLLKADHIPNQKKTPRKSQKRSKS